MFKLFKRAKEKVFPTDVNKVIEQIHNDFDTAGEKLLIEAKEILSKEVDCSKGKRLESLGFLSSKSVVEAKQLQSEKDKKKELATLIEYYSIHYPNNKFITEDAVASICKKYGLLCADVSYYIGEVPEKNLKEIEAFKLRDEDMQTRSNFDDYLAMAQRQAMRQAQSMMNMDWQSPLGLSSLERQIRRPLYSQTLAMPTTEVTRKVKPSFKICAPENEFNTRGLIKSGHHLIPDPIVLQPVKGGYLIVSKWGLEGKDPSLVNEVHN